MCEGRLPAGRLGDDLSLRPCLGLCPIRCPPGGRGGARSLSGGTLEPSQEMAKQVPVFLSYFKDRSDSAVMRGTSH